MAMRPIPVTLTADHDWTSPPLLLKGQIAERGQDANAIAAARRGFLAAYPAETAAQR